MPRKVLIGFGVDVDAVAGWYVRPPRASKTRLHVEFMPWEQGWARTEVKTPRLTSLE